MVDTSKITRVEIIDENGRSYVNMACKDVSLNFQDDEQTLKIFLTNNKPKPLTRDEIKEFLDSQVRENQEMGLYDD